MNRREFLKRMGIVGLVAAAPPIIFDMGKNSHRHKPMELLAREFKTPYYSITEMQDAPLFTQIYSEITDRELARYNFIQTVRAMYLPAENGAQRGN